MTDLDLRAGQIHRGLGVVARWQDIALVIPSDAAHDATVDQMFHDLGPSPTATDLVTAVNQLLADEQLQSVAMVVEATGGPLAMAFGPVEVLIDGVQTLNGADGGVRKQLPPAAQRITIRAAGRSKAAEPVAPYDLRRGVAPGAGLTLITVSVASPPAPGGGIAAPTPPAPPHQQPEPQPVPVAEPVQEPAPVEPVVVEPAVPSPAVEEPQPEYEPIFAPREEPGIEPQPVQADPDPPPGVRSGRFDEQDAEPSDGDQVAALQAERAQPALAPSPLSVPFRSVVLIGASPDGAVTPLPVADAPKSGELSRGELDAGRVEVQGILCQRHHFNNPNSANCMICGLSMLHLTHNLVTGPRPTLGFIVFDDGSTFGLDRSYVIGREPIPAEASDAELLILNENNETLSRTHAELRLEDWTVQLLDMGSTNGTYIWDYNFERWNGIGLRFNSVKKFAPHLRAMLRQAVNWDNGHA